MVKCDYCKEEILKGRYVVAAYRIGVKKGYCSAECKNRAGSLRRGVIHRRFMPKKLDKVDERYIKQYLNELHGV